MPGKNGYGLARDIKEEHGADRPVLIAISGKWTAKMDQLLAKTVGFDHFLMKPADPNQLLALFGKPEPGEAA
jgi:DNA-binding response OmpR family regulator